MTRAVALPRSLAAAEPDAAEPSVAARALSGDREAWAALVARHGHRVVVSLLARGLPLERARELAQETWLRLMEQQRLGKLRELELPGLAIRQASFLALDEGRRTAARAAHEHADPDAHRTAPGPTPEQQLLGRQQLERARVALGACSPSAQRVFTLVYEHPDRPHADVAAEVGLSLQRVRQILCEVRSKLRRAIEEHDHA